MFEEKYRSLFKNIQENEDHKEKVRELMQKELTEMEEKSGKTMKHRPRRYVTAAAVMAVLSLALFKMLGTGDAKSPFAGGDSPPVAAETPQEEDTVLYSSLQFAKPQEISAPAVLNDSSGKIAAFTENILSESSAVIKGTVMDVRFREYRYVIGSEEAEGGETEAVRQSVIYAIRADKIYHADGAFAEGETITVENDLYTYTSLAGSVEKLSAGRQYMLALYEHDGEVYIPADTEEAKSAEKLESRLSVLYPFTAQIQITEDGKYLFPDHWVSLINEETKTVTMDMEEGFGFWGEMKLREDEHFESDFQRIVDTYK